MRHTNILLGPPFLRPQAPHIQSLSSNPIPSRTCRCRVATVLSSPYCSGHTAHNDRSAAIPIAYPSIVSSTLFHNFTFHIPPICAPTSPSYQLERGCAEPGRSVFQQHHRQHGGLPDFLQAGTIHSHFYTQAARIPTDPAVYGEVGLNFITSSSTTLVGIATSTIALPSSGCRVRCGDMHSTM